MSKKRIYVAGKLNDMAVDYIRNLHTMIIAAQTVKEMGFSVYVPGIDFLMGLVCDYKTYDEYFDNNLPWLAVSDAMFVLPNWRTSEGTKREIERAKELGIPVYFTLNELMEGETNGKMY